MGRRGFALVALALLAFVLLSRSAGPPRVAANGITAVSAGFYGHTCALTPAGGVRCWGYNFDGELGNGTTTISGCRCITTPVDVVGLTSGVSSVSGGAWHTCALTVSGGVKCWGSNGFGQLGNGTFSNSSVPVNVLGLTSGVVAISSGRSHSCAITTTSALKCWGDNGEGELGNGSTTSSNTPVDVVDMASGVASVSAGGEHTCAVTASGGAKCWGYNAFGSLGTGSCCGRRPTPVDVVGLTSGVAAVSSTSYFHACALTTAGGVECWGLNANGELGDGTTTTRYFPAPVSGLASGITAVSAGNVHTCALRTTGGVNCWGDNTHGQVGDGGLCGSACTTPTDVQGLTSGVAAVSAGLSHTCAVTSSGFVLCWGVDDYGQLGDGTTGTDATIPVKAEGLGPKAVGGVSELTGAVRTTSSGEGGGWLLAEAAAAVVIGVALSGGVWLAYRRSR